jgi:hypothetical protein
MLGGAEVGTWVVEARFKAAVATVAVWTWVVVVGSWLTWKSGGWY